MENWDDYTLSTDKYTKSEPDPVSREMQDMTATYDFTDMARQAKSSFDIRNAETADFTETMQNAEAVGAGAGGETIVEAAAEAVGGASEAGGETIVEAAAEPAVHAGPEQGNSYGFTMRDPEPAAEAAGEASGAGGETVVEAAAEPAVHAGPEQGNSYGFTMRDPEPAAEAAPAAEPDPLEEYISHDYTDTEFEPSGYAASTEDYVHDSSADAAAGAAGAAAAAAAGSAFTGGSLNYGSGYGSSYGTGYQAASGSSYDGSSSYGGYGSGSGSSGYGGGSGSGYGGGGYGGNGSGSNSDYYETPRRKQKKVKKPMQITRAGFVLTLIFCMLLTSALTVAGLAFYGNHYAPGTTNATDYTLTSSDETLSYNNIIGKVQDSVVSITTESTAYDMWMQNYVTQGAGSGVIIQSNGYIVTCNHVIEGATKIKVTLSDNKEYDATLIGADAENDVAVLKIKATGLTAANYGDSSKLNVGDAVIAIGNPLGELSNTATTGIISALDRELTIDGRTMNLMQTDASINPGNSGGALFDSAGNLVGIVVAKSSGSDVEGLGFAIPINRVAELAKDMIENKDSFKQDNNSQDNYGVGDAAIGVTVGELPDENATQYGYPRGGIVIQSVTSKNAQMAGIQPNDMILTFEGKEVKTVDELHSALKDHKPGDKVTVGIFRNGEQLELDVTLTQAGE